MSKQELTRKEIHFFPQDRRLDALVGEQVMGLELVEDALPYMPKYYLPEYERTYFRDVPHYCTDIASAFEVVEKMRTMHKQFITIIDNPHLNYDVRFSGDLSPEFVRLSCLPHAICKAALLAVIGGSVNE